MRTAPALSSAAASSLKLDTIERQAKDLTRTQAEAMRRVRDRGCYAWCERRGRAGGAVSRMFDRMAALGLVTRAPHEITTHGRAVLDAYDTAHPKKVR